jgi:hypothetical protein
VPYRETLISSFLLSGFFGRCVRAETLSPMRWRIAPDRPIADVEQGSRLLL